MPSLRDLAELAPPQPMGEKDPEREAVKSSKRARIRDLLREYNDPAVPANQKVMCVTCNTRIPPGEAFAMHFDARMLLALVHCLGCYHEEPYNMWKSIIVKEEPDRDGPRDTG